MKHIILINYSLINLYNLSFIQANKNLKVFISVNYDHCTLASDENMTFKIIMLRQTLKAAVCKFHRKKMLLHVCLSCHMLLQYVI